MIKYTKCSQGFGTIFVLAIIASVLVLAGGGYFAYQRFAQKAGPPEINSFKECVKAGYPVAGGVIPSFCVTPDGRRFVEKVDERDGVACTQEAKICPDGFSVGRTGPNCEFAQCPEEIDTSGWKTYRNEQYGFEVRYPPGWEVELFNTGSEDVISIGTLGESTRKGLTILTDRGSNPRELSIRDLIRINEHPLIKGQLFEFYGKIGGTDAMISKGDLVVFTKENDVLGVINNLMLYSVVGEIALLDESSFREILSTLRFIE